MGLIIGNRALQGSPNLPYLQDQSLANEDTYMQFVFLDRTNTPVVPITIMVELDDLSNSINMDQGPNTFNALGSAAGVNPYYIYPAFASGANPPWELQLTALLMQMSYPYQGSQICKFKMLWTGLDSVYGNPFSGIFENIIELVSTPTVSGAF
jgi:hypothetical protein